MNDSSSQRDNAERSPRCHGRIASVFAGQDSVVTKKNEVTRRSDVSDQ